MEQLTKQNKLVIDVTTLTQWTRPPVGIVRTQLEFVKYLLDNKPKTVYFKFNNERTALIEVPIDEIQNTILNLLNTKEKISQKSSNHQEKSHSIWKKVRDIYATEGLRYLLIRGCKKFCPYQVKDMIKHIYFKLFLNHNQIQNSIGTKLFLPEIHYSNSTEVPLFLTKNTTLVSIGLDWDHSNYSLLFWLKKKIEFKVVSAFYDGIPILYPHLVQSYAFSQMFFSHFYYLTYLSDKVFCISNFSKNQFTEIAHQHHIRNLPTLESIYLGSNVLKNRDNFLSTMRKHSSNYILYVSTIEARKNHKLLLQVWEKLLETQIDLPALVLVGMRGWGVDDVYQIYDRNPKLQEVVHFYENVEDDELVSLYQNAQFTLFPSYAEGWGLGAVESMLYGKPVIIANCPALIEATQGLMPTLNPNDVEAWTETVITLMNNQDKLNNLKTLIKEEFKPRTWDTFSKEFYSFINK